MHSFIHSFILEQGNPHVRRRDSKQGRKLVKQHTCADTQQPCRTSKHVRYGLIRSIRQISCRSTQGMALLGLSSRRQRDIREDTSTQQRHPSEYLIQHSWCC